MRTDMSHGNAQHMVRDVQDARKQTTLTKYVEGRLGRPAKMTRDAELFMAYVKALKTQR